MRAFIIYRILQAFVTTVIVTFLVFLMLHLMPGDPVHALLGEEVELDKVTVDFYRAKYGLDRPIMVQYVTWLGRAATGDFGRSTVRERPIGKSLKNRFGVTMQLVFFAKLVSISIAFPLGLLSGLRRGSPIDHFSRLFAITGVAMPNFWLAILLILLFTVALGWLPAAGYVPLTENPMLWLKSMTMPAIVLGTSGAATMTRQLRSSVLEVVRQDYIRTARAKGLSEKRVTLVHVLKPALLPVVTILGLSLGRSVGGSVIIETLFALPGMGAWAIEGILSKDFPIIQAVLLMVGMSVVLFTLITDLVYGFLDPRITYR